MLNFYEDLYQLITKDDQAHRYFTSLPLQIQQTVNWHAKELHTFSGLQSYANMLIEDKQTS